MGSVMSGRIGFEYEPQAQPSYRTRDDRPMRILVVGDFSGRSNRGLLEHGAGLAERPVVPVDVDNFDDVLFRLAPRRRQIREIPEFPRRNAGSSSRWLTWACGLERRVP